MLGNGLIIAACAVHHLDVVLATVLEVDMVCPHGVAENALSIQYRGVVN